MSADDEAIAKKFSDAMDRSNAQDPQSPDTLNIRLGFAAFLAKSEGGDCRMRLEKAQNRLDTARASLSGFALPFALAREAAVDYQIHAARAFCDGVAVLREVELRAAVESARHAVDLYREQFDAVSMATMQFNVGETYHELGDDAAATAALESAIEMDREYGFGKDADENYQILGQWKGQPASTEEVAARMKDFPQRSTTLSFGWSAGKAELTLMLEYQQLSDGKRLNIHATKSAERRVQRRGSGWAVSFEPLGTRFEINDWPNDDSLAPGVVACMTRMLLQFHDFDLGPAGNFTQSSAAHDFESSMRSELKAVTEFLAQNKVPARLIQQISKESHTHGNSVEALVAEAYDLGTGAWPGATLDQGVWYDMNLPLSLPGAPGLFVTHQIEFAFTRQVPCVADASDEACVEIVLRARPDPEELKRLLANVSQKMGLRHRESLQLSSSTYMRLVTSPKTLQWVESDVRRYAYWAATGISFDHPVMEYERTHAVSGPMARSE